MNKTTATKTKLSAYERGLKARENRVRKGKSILVKAEDLRPGMFLHDHGYRFSHNEVDENGRNVVKFVPEPGRKALGYRENLDTLVEVRVER